MNNIPATIRAEDERLCASFEDVLAEFEAKNPGQTWAPVHPGAGTFIRVWKDTGEAVMRKAPA